MNKFLTNSIFILILFLSSNIFSNEKINIIIKGSEFIDKEVIYSILNEYPSNIDDSTINIIIKKLKSTGNFKDITINQLDNDLIITVEENIKIKDLNFDGNKRFKDKELSSILETISFSSYFNEKDIELFLDEVRKLYYSFGYNQASIEYQIAKTENTNFINLNFNINEGKISKINKVFFDGNKNYKSTKLLSLIKSQPKNFLKFYTNSNYKEYVAKNDIIRLKKHYLNNGYRNIEIDLDIEYLSQKNNFNIYFVISEGDKFELNIIDLEIDDININDKHILSIKKIINNFKKKISSDNSTYSQLDILKIKDDISEYLFQNGYKFFAVNISEKIINNKIDIYFKLNSTEPSYVNKINIYGNSRTDEKVIRRELTFAEGDTFTSDQINKSKNNLNRLNLFKSINIESINLNNEFSNIDIYIEEKSTGDFKIGLSFDTFGGATFITGLNEKNIAGVGRNLDLTINTANDNTTYSIGVLEPHIFNSEFDLIYSLDYAEKDYSASSSYNLDSLKLESGLRYDLSDKVIHNILFNYKLNKYTVTNKENVSSIISKSEGSNASISLNNILIYDNLNSFMIPTNGDYLNYTNIFSPVTNSDDGFIKNEFTYKKYKEYSKNILSLQARFGSIFSLQNSEILNDDKYSLGGRWLRGFDIYGAGPRNSKTSYIGGNNLIVAKIDASRPLNDFSSNPFYLNIFTDIGKVWNNKNTPNYNKESIRASYGFGLKFYSPIGPIGFSWAFPISDENYDVKRMFLFNIGDLN